MTPKKSLQDAVVGAIKSSAEALLPQTREGAMAEMPETPMLTLRPGKPATATAGDLRTNKKMATR